MKRILHILGLLCFILLLNPEGGFSQVGIVSSSEECKVTEEDASTPQKETQFVLSNELKNSTCLAPRTLQVSNNSVIQRLSKNLFKQLNLYRLKEYNSQRKIWEFVSVCQTINYSSLLAGLGYHVYALRKIII